jgi:hypothetical protein
VTSSFSLIREDIEKRAPTGITDGFGKAMALEHATDIQVFYSHMLIVLDIRLGRLEMEITALTAHLEMGLGNILGCLTASFATLLTTAELTLFAPAGLLPGAIVPGISNGISLGVSQQDLQAHIDTAITMLTPRGSMFSLWVCLTGNERLPLVISTQEQIDRLGFPFKGAMHLEGLARFARDNQVFLVFVQLAVFALLTQLDAMPLGGGFEAREPSLHRQFFAGKKTFEGFGQPISKGLYRCGGNMLAATSLKAGSRPDVSGSCHSPPCLKAGALWPPKVEWFHGIVVSCMNRGNMIPW